jgi:hypothetical protein
MSAIFAPLVPYVDYWLNYEQISEELCENKAQPELECNGKCHLMKEVQKTADETPQNPNKPIKPVKKIMQDVVFFSAPALTNLPECVDETRQTYFHLTLKITSYKSDCWHPPQTKC